MVMICGIHSTCIQIEPKIIKYFIAFPESKADENHKSQNKYLPFLIESSECT